MLTWTATPFQRGHFCSFNWPYCCLYHHINEVTVIMSHLISPQCDSPSPSLSLSASCCCHLAPGGGGKGERAPRAENTWLTKMLFACSFFLFRCRTGWSPHTVRQHKNCQEIQIFAGFFPPKSWTFSGDAKDTLAAMLDDELGQHCLWTASVCNV